MTLSRCRYGGRHYRDSKGHIACCTWIRTGWFDGRIGDGDRQRTCRVPDAGITPSAQADGKVRQPAGVLLSTRRAPAPGPAGTRVLPLRLQRSLPVARPKLGSPLPSRPGRMGFARTPRALAIQSESRHRREASREPEPASVHCMVVGSIGGPHAAWVGQTSALPFSVPSYKEPHVLV